MSIFKFKPIIIKGHTFPEYLSRCGREYIMGRGEILKDKSRLKPLRRYWEIDGEYYQVGLKKELRIGFTAISVAAIVTSIVLPIYFCVIAPMERYQDYNFKYWNSAPALKTLKTYVRHAVTPGNKDYVPKDDRIATFDMDGTLFGERSPIYIEWLMFNDYFDYIKNNQPDDPRIQDTSIVKVPNKYYEEHQGESGVDEFIGVEPSEVYNNIKLYEGHHDDDIPLIKRDEKNYATLEMAEAHVGAQLFSTIVVDDYIDMVDKYLDFDAPLFKNLKFKDMFYKPMIEVVNFLQRNNFKVYVVSGTDRFMVRVIVNEHLTIPYNNVIGMDVALEFNEEGELARTDELIVKNVEEAKVYLITQEIGKKPVLSFGNSGGDVAMHDFTLTNDKYKSQAYMVLADDDVREYARTNHEQQKADWTNKGYQIFSMKDDWKTIYGKDVTKTK